MANMVRGRTVKITPQLPGREGQVYHGLTYTVTEAQIFPPTFFRLDSTLSMAVTVQDETQKSLAHLVFDLFKISFHHLKTSK